MHPVPPESRRRPAAGYVAACFLRVAEEAFIRSDTASFSLAVIGRRFLVGVASDAVSATGVAPSRRRLRGGAPSRGLRRGRGLKERSCRRRSTP